MLPTKGTEKKRKSSLNQLPNVVNVKIELLESETSIGHAPPFKYIYLYKSLMGNLLFSLFQVVVRVDWGWEKKFFKKTG